jgi:transcription elongation GreA/GreB family factor
LFRLEDFFVNTNLQPNTPRTRTRRKPQAQVAIGSQITIREVNTCEREVYTLVHPDDADIDLNRLSSFSPLGKAIGGRRAGEVVELDAPAGTLRFEIEAVLGPAEAPHEAAVAVG